MSPVIPYSSDRVSVLSVLSVLSNRDRRARDRAHRASIRENEILIGEYGTNTLVENPRTTLTCCPEGPRKKR